MKKHFKNTFSLLFFLVVIVFFVSGCEDGSSSGDPGVVAAVEASATATDTALPSPTETEEPTRTPTITATAEPTETPVPPTETATVTPTEDSGPMIRDVMSYEEFYGSFYVPYQVQINDIGYRSNTRLTSTNLPIYRNRYLYEGPPVTREEDPEAYDIWWNKVIGVYHEYLDNIYENESLDDYCKATAYNYTLFLGLSLVWNGWDYVYKTLGPYCPEFNPQSESFMDFAEITGVGGR